MKNLLVTMLYVPTLCFGMMQPQRYVSSWIRKQTNHWMGKRKYTQSPRIQTKSTEPTALETERREMIKRHNAELEKMYLDREVKTQNEIVRQKQYLKDAEALLKKDGVLDGIIPYLKTRRKRIANNRISEINENLYNLNVRRAIDKGSRKASLWDDTFKSIK